MRILALGLLVASACVATDTDQDLSFHSSGKADVQELEVPISIAAGKSMTLKLTADGPFEASLQYPQAVDAAIRVGTAEKVGREPVLVVEAPRNTTTRFEVVVTNRGASDLEGTFTVRNPTDTCDAAWLPWFDSLAKQLDAADGFIDTSERATIDAIVKARPCEATSDTAYTRWLDRFGAQLDAADGFIDSNEAAFVTILRGVQPAATGDDAFAAWNKRFDRLMVAVDGFVDSNEQAFIDQLLAVRPPARGDSAYISWAAGFEPFLAGVDGFIDSNEANVLRTLLRGKPCATGADAEAAWSQLASVASSDAGTFLAAARPAAGCN